MTASSSAESLYPASGPSGISGESGWSNGTTQRAAYRPQGVTSQHHHHHHHHQLPHQPSQQTPAPLATGTMPTTTARKPPLAQPATSGGGTTAYRGLSAAAKERAERKGSQSTTLPSRVSQIYYKHGLFLSSYPTTTTSIALAIIIFCCYPLLNIPLPGTIPTKVIFPHTESISENLHHSSANLSSEFYNPFSPFTGGNMFNIYNISLETPFPWARIEPLLYVQQIILRSSVVPWEDDLLLTDAFRGPLYEVFKLVEMIRNHEDENKITLSHLCLHVENVKRTSQQTLFPEYNCLLLSPANLWQQNLQSFNKDSNLLNTIFVNHNLQKTKVSNAEMLFGISLRDTGVKRYPMRVRPRVIQYAVTLILRENNPSYMQSLKQKLIRAYPLHQKEHEHPLPADDATKLAEPSETASGSPTVSASTSNQQPSAPGSGPGAVPQPQSIMYIFYPGEFNWHEVLPQCIAFCVLFSYVYFSVRKIEAIRSRLMLASCAVLTVLGSLLMSLGLCFFFGLTISFQSKGVYPYLVILVGLENVLVITKSVLTTDNNLDVKIRVAQGLSREGWSITKNLLTEITILTGGLATFVPVIQEFCIFAMVGLVSDFLLQMLFFATVLALDIKRVEYSTEVRRLPKMLYFNSELRRGAGAQPGCASAPLDVLHNGSMHRSRSHPKLAGLEQSLAGHKKPSGSLSGGAVGGKASAKIPKRLRIVNFWARTRFFQRGFMIWMVLWISNIIYNAGLIEELFVIDRNITAAGGSHATAGAPLDAAAGPATMHRFEQGLGGGEFGGDGGGGGDTNGDPAIGRSAEMDRFGYSKLVAAAGAGMEGMLGGGGGGDRGIPNVTEQLNRLKHPDYYETVYQLSNFHWSSILKQYNVSLSGRYVTVLPAIKLSHAVSPQTAVTLRNAEEKAPHHFQWKALAVALDPLDFSDTDPGDGVPGGIGPIGNAPFYPKTPMEILLTCMLLVVSTFVVTYTMVVLYRCVCTRNYAEWRASWHSEPAEGETDAKPEQCLLEGVPIQVNGHAHRIECLVTDGNMIASSCLQGQVKVWDVSSGEMMAEIDRCSYFEMQLLHHRASTGSSSPPGSALPSPTIGVLLRNDESGSPITGVQEVFPQPSTSYGSLTYDESLVQTTPPYSSSPPLNAAGGFTSFKLKKKLHFNFTSLQDDTVTARGLTDPKLFDFRAQYDRFFTSCSPLPRGIGGEPSDLRNRFTRNGLRDAKQALTMDASYAMAPERGTDQQQRTGGRPTALSSECPRPPGAVSPSQKHHRLSPIWCLDFLDNLIVIGCADGRLEFWEGTTGSFKCIYESETTHNNGITGIKLTGDRVIAARLSGRIDFFRLETYTQGRQIDWGFTSTYRRTHMRTGSAGSLSSFQSSTATGSNPGGSAASASEELRCILEFQQQGHQQPVTCLEVAGNIAMTGSQDHTLKVFRVDNHQLLYTLHGHCGPITCLFIDQWQSGMAGSGSQDGLLCVWELTTGACMYKIQAHDDSIVALSGSPSYVISLGLDERIRVWDRFQGHPLSTITVSHAYSALIMLTPSLLVTGKPGALVVWDARSGEVVREVKLDCSNMQLCPKIMLPAGGSVICDYGNQMRIVRFPLVAADKCD
ncbi:sterol regulatory element-binding protein cleavage-activating protein-like [Anopheles albimanus]|uniref:sterol regulatory element-binding protein cleavage-activating protein-like n=1 Tax=Anopheles albimanus TaxID=7167 RepID=UPI001640153F|nr:sterol regulatory element-binding protein cleavage-activating protein-like [Anopheles albimanus]XP_035792382.1 sterol regulatory element-binding protein cleavage-activating protein-like [Anopheles albimanus]XP_035792383.1 sterol regulatory element-binding protein cleavage-activating protein-like [Anopheles albimanus]XP_035792384.1 sterol regulatory element-binding protein cleavage-activating protein-like [Anopheles albimanus]